MTSLLRVLSSWPSPPSQIFLGNPRLDTYLNNCCPLDYTNKFGHDYNVGVAGVAIIAIVLLTVSYWFIDAQILYPSDYSIVINLLFSGSLAVAQTSVSPSMPKAQMRPPMQFVKCTACLRRTNMDFPPQVHRSGFPPKHNRKHHDIAHLATANYTHKHAQWQSFKPTRFYTKSSSSPPGH